MRIVLSILICVCIPIGVAIAVRFLYGGEDDE